MTIASVEQACIQTNEKKYNRIDGAALESPEGAIWLESIKSFRYEPMDGNKPYTVRKETGKGGDYWYAYRKVAGRLHKKYVGKTSEIDIDKLEEIAEALNTPPQPRVTEVKNKVTEVTDTTSQKVTEAIGNCDSDRLTALELQMQALRESLEALRSELLGKPEGLGNFSELPNPYRVTDSELQIELSNLKTELSNLATENEKAQADYAALLESSTVVADNLRRGVRELQARLEVERADREEVEVQLADREKQIAELRSELAAEQTRYKEQDEEFWELNERWEEATKEVHRLKQETTDRDAEIEKLRSELKQKSAAPREFLEAADLLNQLKSKRKKSKTDLADLEAILEILES
jgi:chromosome segregation ATPase